MGTRENKIEKYLDSEVKDKLDGITRKWVSPHNNGVPDRIVITKQGVCFVEVKTVDGILSPDQIREHKRLKEAGASVTTVYGHDQVDMLIKELSNAL